MLEAVLLLLIPLTLVGLTGLLFLTELLDRRSSNALMRMAVRSPRSSPEVAEQVVSLESARRLRAAGMADRR